MDRHLWQRYRSLKLSCKVAEALARNGIRITYLSDADEVYFASAGGPIKLAGPTNNLVSVIRFIFPSTEPTPH